MPKTTTVLVTGATGHLGTVLVQRLLETGATVRYLTRSGEPPGLIGSQAIPVAAELHDSEQIRSAAEGAAVVYHSAARINIMPGDSEELHRVNVGGTKSVLAAAREAGVPRFVCVGSIEAFPLEDKKRPVSEEAGIDPDHTVMEYGRTKALAMQEVLAANGTGIECVVCAPTAFIGPPDYRRSPVGQVIVDLMRQKLPAYVTGGFDFSDVRDIADGVIAAGTRGRPGETYLLGGRYATVGELMELAEAASGVARPRLCLSTGLIQPFMPLVELYYRATGRPPRYTRSSIHLLTLGVTVDSSKAERELGYTRRPLEQTIRDTVDWFRETGAAGSDGSTVREAR